MSPTPIDATPTLDAPAQVKALLQRLHTASLAQEAELSRTSGAATVLDVTMRQNNASSSGQQRFDDLMRDKMIALEEDKALFVYHLCRALRATRIVEAGTSFGISTIYLALAVGQNVAAAGSGNGKEGNGKEGKVVATENEPSKIAKARAHWKEAGAEVERWIELREGDLRQTLAADVPADIDFVLFDIWTPMVMPVLRLLEPKLKKGAVLVADNVVASTDGYREFHEYLQAHRDTYRSLILPYSGGLELIIYDP